MPATKKSRFPDSLVLIFSMIVLAQLLSYVLPHGSYERDGNDHDKVIDGTYAVLVEVGAKGSDQGQDEDQSKEEDQGQEEPTEESPRRHQSLPWYAFLAKIPKGLTDAQEIIFLVFLVGGVIAVLRKTGAIDAFLFATVRRLGGSPWILIAGCLLLFACGSFVIGMGEEYMPLIPIIVTMCLAMKMDSIVAMGLVWVPYAIGWACAGMNPFGVLIAQDIAGLEAMSGLGFRLAILPLFLLVAFHHIHRYARRIRTNPGHSFVADVDYGSRCAMPEDTALTPARIAVLLVFVGGILLFTAGAMFPWWFSEGATRQDGWYIAELNTVFLGVGILAALVARLGPNVTARTFIDGAAQMTSAALLVGFARTIGVVLDDGQIIDTVVHGIASVLQGAGSDVAAVGMLLVQTVCNFFVPSGSGQAYLTMPIMSPLATLTDVPQQTAVLAYQFGDGFTNMVIPTNALVMGTLALGGIPYGRWVRFVTPLLVKLLLLAIVVLVITVHFADQIGFQ